MCTSTVFVELRLLRTSTRLPGFFRNNPVNSFSTDNRGLAQDKRDKILWYRCAAGQSYKNSECKGKHYILIGKKPWLLLKNFSEKSGKKWRLPSKKELKSIMLDQCINPAVDVTVFKDLEVNNFWTSSDSLNSDLFRDVQCTISRRFIL